MADVNANIGVNIDTSAALANLKALQRQISAFHTSMAKSGAAASAVSAGMQQNLINSINQTGKFSASMRNIRSTTESFTNALEKNKLSMREYFRYAGASTKTFGRLFRTEFNTIEKVARERVKTLQTQYIKMGRDANGAMRAIAVRPLALDMQNLGTQTAIAAQKQALFNQLVKQGSTQLLNFGKNTQWAGRQLMVGFTVPLTMLGVVAGRTFMQLEEQAIRFRRVYGETFTASAETEKMLEQIKGLAQEFTKYGVAVEKTMEMAATAAASGKMGAELLAQVSQATRLAVLGGVEQEQALETTISLTNAFGLAAEDLTKKIDFLNAVENQTVVSIEDLTIAIPKAAPVVKQLGGNVEDLAFFLTAMKEGGINASEGANALKSGLASLINPTGKASEMLQSFGINIQGIVEANKGDVKGLVIDFAKALDTLDPLTRARAIEQLFGKFQFSRLSTLFKNVIQEGSQASRVLKLTAATTEELAILSERELARIENTTTYKFKKAMEDLKSALAPVGEEFLKALTPIIEIGTKILKAFDNLDSGTKTFIVSLVGIAGVIGPAFLMTFGLIANGFANLIKMFAFLGRAFGGVKGSTTDLAAQTQYMTQEQLEAAAVAASLDQTHMKLRQTFTSEASAVNALTQAYQRATGAQAAFNTGAVGRTRPGKTKGYADGVISVPGPKGAGDVVPAMLSPGEAVIPADKAKKYRGFIKNMISGKIPGFFRGTPGTSSMDFDQDMTTQMSHMGGVLSGLTEKEARARYGKEISRLIASGIYDRLGMSPSKDIAFGKSNVFTGVERLYPGILEPGLTKSNQGTANPNAARTGASYLKELRGLPRGLFGSGILATIESVKKAGGTINIPEKDLIRYMGNVEKNYKSELKRNYSQPLRESDIYRIYNRSTQRAISKITDPNIRAQIQDLLTYSKAKLTPALPPVGSSGSTRKYQRGRNIQSMLGRITRPGGLLGIMRGTKFEEAYNQKILSKTKLTFPTDVKENLTALKNQLGRKQRQALYRQLIAASYDKNQTRRFDTYRAIVGNVSNIKSGIVDGNTGTRKPSRARVVGGSPADNRIVGGTAVQSGETILTKNSTQTIKNGGAVNVPGVGTIRMGKFGPMKFPGAVDGIPEGQTQSSIREGIDKRGRAYYYDEVQKKRISAKEAANIRLEEENAKRQSKLLDKQEKTGKPRMAGALGGLGVVASLGIMGASMMGGSIGETAQQLMFPVMMLSSMLPMLANKFGIAAVAIGALIGGIIYLNTKLRDATKSGLDTAKAMSMTKDKLNDLSMFTGSVTASQIAEKRREDQLAGSDQVGRQFGDTYLESESGQSMLADAQRLVSSGRSNQDVAANFAQQLSYAIMQGAVTQDQARSIANGLAAKLKDYSIGININGQLTQLFGVNGENLLKGDPVNITLGIQKESFKQQNIAFNNSLAEMEKNAEVTGGTIANLIGGGAMILGGGILAATGIGGALGVGLMAGGVATMAGAGIMEGVADQEANNKARGVAVQLGAEQLAQNQGLLDSLEMQYNNQIAQLEIEKEDAKTKKEKAKIEQEINDKITERDAGLKAQKEANAEIFNSLLSQAKTLGSGFTDAINFSIDETFKDASGALKAAVDLAKSSLSGLADGDFKTTLQIGLASGEFDPITITNLINANKESGGAIETQFNMLVRAKGTADANQFIQLLGASGVSGKEYEIMLKFINEDETAMEYNLAAIEQLNNMKSRYNVDIKVTSSNIDKIGNFLQDTKDLPDTVTKKVITDFAAELPEGSSKAMLQSVIENWKALSNGKNKISTQFIVDFVVGQSNPAAMAAWYFSLGPGKNIPQNLRFDITDEQIAAAFIGQYNNEDDNKGKNPPKDPGPGGTGEKQLSALAKKVIKDYQDQVTILEKKRDKLAKINDELNRQKELEDSLTKQSQDMKQAFISGNYVSAAIIKQNMAYEKLQFDKETQRLKLEERIKFLEERLRKIEDSGKVSKADKKNSKKNAMNSFLKGISFFGGYDGMASGGLIKKYAGGGLITGPGTGTSDSILGKVNFASGGFINVSNGEFIQRASAVERYGTEFMNAVNNETYSPNNSVVYNVSMTVNGGNANASEIANKVMQKLNTISVKNNKSNRVNA